MIKDNITLREDWLRCKGMIEEHIVALATHLEGLVNAYAPGVTLRGSFESNVQRVDNSIMVEVGTPLEYGEYVEFGTKPHFPPIKPIMQWVERTMNVTSVNVSFASDVKTHKPQTIVRGGKRQFRKSKFATTWNSSQSRNRNMAIYQIAKAVQWKIAHYGTRGQMFMSRALGEMGLFHYAQFDQTGTRYIVDMETYLRSKIDGFLKASGVAK